MSSTGLLRVRRVLADAGLTVDAPAQRMDSVSNEVWLVGPFVVRLATTATTRRLAHEAEVNALVARLAPAAAVPRVLCHGVAEFGEWLVMERMIGEPLLDAWGRLSEHEREGAVRDLADVVRAIHRVEVPAGALRLGDAECPHPLPLSKLMPVLAAIRRDPAVDQQLLDDVATLVEELLPSLRVVPDGRLVHGDLHFANALVHRGQVSALLDFEYARRSWPDLDLDILSRFVEAPEALGPAGARLGADAFRPVLGWFAAGYPELFEQPGLDDRLLLYRLAYDLRDLAAQLPVRPNAIGPLHPISRLRRLVGRGARMRTAVVIW